MKFITFVKEIVMSQSGVSSKRVCGLLGWITCLGVLIFCTIKVVQAPEMIDMIILAIMGLLGIDSVTGIWKGPKKDTKE